MLILAFIGMCLAWGFSWIAIKFQLESLIAPEISLFYRFFTVTIIMIALCLITKNRLNLFKTEWKYFILIALTNFCVNFIIGYHASKYIASGVVAVIFSLSIIATEIFKNFFDGKKIEKKIIVSSICGSIGLLLFVLPNIDFKNKLENHNILTGVTLSLITMTVFSFGNYIVEKNKKHNDTPLFTSITFGSGIGSFYLLLINLILNNQFTFDYSKKYIFSLIYLTVFASVFGIICFYYLIQKVGAVKANYTTLLYPIIALSVSSFYENFKFTFLGTLGLALITGALAIEFIKTNKIPLLKETKK